MSDLKSGKMTTIKKWALKELEQAFRYYQSIGWCIDTKNNLSNMISLTNAFKRMDAAKTTVLDEFMSDLNLRAFLIIHSVFKPDAYEDGEFIENYMANRLMVTDEQVARPFKKIIPEDILKKFAIFDLEAIPFEVHPYRIEYGCRTDPVTGKYNRNPITIIDLNFDAEQNDSFKPVEFISQFEDIAL